MDIMRLLVCGSRTWQDVQTIQDRIDRLPSHSILIEGGASGADTIAREAAIARGLHVATMKPLYSFFPRKSAPLARNDAMIRMEPSLVIAFQRNNSRGTQYTIDKARRFDIPVEIVSQD